MSFPTNMKSTVVAALLERRKNFTGTDTQFAIQFGINNSVYSRLKTATSYDGLMRDAQWINIARELDIALQRRKWNMVRTDVYDMIEADVLFCQTYGKSLMLADECGIGKTFTAKHLSRTLTNCFYVDGSQCPGKNEFTKAIAKAVGVDDHDRLVNMRGNIKYMLNLLDNPVVIIDEAGALDDKSFKLIIELWNATNCGFYMMGADGLRAKIERNMSNKKVGWAELFSRFNEKYNSIVPAEKSDRIAFYKKLITEVVKANVKDGSNISTIVQRCLVNDSGRISGLRRAETLVLLSDAA